MRCIAVGCQTGRKSGLRIHSFPRDPKRRLEWAVNVNRTAENGKVWVPPKDCYYGVCEAHFKEDQYEPRRTDRKLKPFAVPTLFSHGKVPKRRRRLVRGGSTSSSISATTAVDTAAEVTTTTSLTTAATVSTVMTPAVSFSVAKSLPAHLQSATNHASWAEQAQYMQVIPSAMPKLLTSPVNTGPAFTVATSGGNVNLSPANAPHEHHCITGDPPVLVTEMRAPPVLGPNARTPNTNSVLPSVSGLPHADPFILVPVSKPNMVPVPSTATRPSTQLPVVSVESLAPNAKPPVTKAAGMTPILARPTGMLHEKVTDLWQETVEMRRKITELSHQAVHLKASLARQTELLSRFLRLDQIEYLQNKPTQWTEPTLRQALDIYCCSPEAYRKLLVAHFPFPMETALRTFCIENGVREGVPTELMQMDMCPEVDGEEGNENVNIVWL
ncbi:hypothetical protein HPB49_020336 [Dermacentor silvarum]|uniref:Uncharacterized protein n=1 Tax=Dermacentor silvarum TaxID=543639 RepID=A0ACB8E316_DERSI|nr:uncharacterized protein LOC125942342 [Dermacentor silvarum]KAH7980936.1 hypothetical protein HPB49_020336 [Dermacentor silvarum]